MEETGAPLAHGPVPAGEAALAELVVVRVLELTGVVVDAAASEVVACVVVVM